MLMLERAAETVNPSECNDPAVLLACSLGSDSCPAACRAEEETTVDENGNKVVVKSGDLSVTATAAEGKKVVKNGISELDTITLRASEAITLNSVTLERYGLSAYGDIKEVWLENVNWERISQGEKTFNSKDVVTLTIKKEYRNLEADDSIIVVVSTDTAANASSLWVKVTAVESSAKNLDLSNYSPYLYDMVSYTSSTVTIVKKGKATTTYHYVEGNSYEIGRFQVKAGNAAILVNGFTLTNKNAGLDLDKYLDNVTISLSDGTEVKNVSWNVNKDEELKASFDAVSIGINKNAIFVVEATFKDLDKYNQDIELTFKNTDSLNVQEEKSGVRASFNNNVTLGTYTFQGGKIEVSNEKLSDNIDAAAGSSDITIGKGKITLNGESIELYGFDVTVSAAGLTAVDTATPNPNVVTIKQDPAYVIEELRMLVNGEEISATADDTFTAGTTATDPGSRVYHFPKINVDETTNVEFVVDLKDNGKEVTEAGTKKIVTLSNSKLTFDNDFTKAKIWDKIGQTTNVIWKYVDARSNIGSDDFAGSISLSNVRLQAARGSLTNTAKDVEFLSKQAARKVIFDGTYTAQKQDVYLNEFAVSLNQQLKWTNDDVTFYLYIDGKEVASQEYSAAYAPIASIDADFAWESFSNILVKKWEKVSIKVEANVNAEYKDGSTYSPTILIKWEDKDWNTAGFANEAAWKIKVVSAGSVTISESAITPKESVLVNDTNVNLARFTVKSSKNTEGMTLKNFTLEPTTLSATPLNTVPTNSADSLSTNDIRVRVAGQDLVAWIDYRIDSTNHKIIVDELSEDITSAGVDVEVLLKNEFANDSDLWAQYAYTLSDVNGSNPGTKFNKLILRNVPYIKAQENKGDSTTKFTFGVDKDSKNYPVKNLVLYAANWTTPLNTTPLTTVEDGTTLEITNGQTVEFVGAIGWGDDQNILVAAVPAVAAAVTAPDVANIGTYYVKGATCNGTPGKLVDSSNCIYTKTTDTALDGGKTYYTITTEWSNAVMEPEIKITKSEFRDFFKVGDAEAQVFRTK